MSISRTSTIEFGTRVGRALIMVAMLAVFIRLVGADSFGVFVLYQAVLATAAIVVDAGIGSAVQKRITEDATASVMATSIALKLALLTVFSIPVLLGAEFLNGYFGAAIAFYVLPGVAVQQLGRLGLHGLRGELRVAEAAIIQFIGEMLILVSGVAFALLGHGLEGLLWAFLLGWGVIVAVAFLRLEFGIARLSLDTARSLLSFSKYSFVSSVAGPMSYSWVDTIIIGALLSPQAIAAYETAWRVASAVVLLSQSIATALFPQVSKWAKADKLHQLEKLFPDAVTFSLLPVIPAIVGAWLINERLLAIVFSPETVIAGAALVVLLVGKIPEAINNIAGRSLYGLDAPEWPALGSTLQILVNVPLNVILVLEVGLVGAALATTLAFLCSASVNTWALSKKISVTIQGRELGSLLVASGIMGGVLLVSLSVLPVAGIPSLLATIAIGIITYGLVLTGTPVRHKMVSVVARLP